MRLSIFTNKVAFRIFILLITAALIPVVIMALLSLDQVRTITKNQLTNNLRQEVKLIGLSVYDRLLHVEDKLNFYTSVLKSGESLHISDKREQGQIYGFVHTEANNNKPTLFGSNLLIPEFDEKQRQQLRAGKSIILVIPSENSTPHIYMSKLVDTNKVSLGILSAKIRHKYLWGNDDIYPSDTALCVFGSGVIYLHCSGNMDNRIVKQFATGNPGNPSIINKTLNSNDNLIGRWRLFLMAKYSQKEWTFMLIKDRASALSGMALFSTNYVLVILMALIMVILLSINLIRRNTKPLEAMMRGIRQISDNKFDVKVNLDSKDEFGDVATAFNSMSEKIGTQIERLKTQAEIDQLILSRPSMDDIVKIAAEGVENLTNCKCTGLAFTQDEKKKLFQLSGKCISEQYPGKIGSITITSHIYRKISLGNLLLGADDNDLITKLNDCFDIPCNIWLALYIAVMEDPAAILFIGCDLMPSGDEIESLKELSSRIAVAYSNAAWEDKLYYQAHYDNLTGLPNRLLMYDRLQQELNHIKRTNDCFAVLFIDLDRFKNVNDSIGHEYGDMLLKIMAERIESCIRQDDTVARLGGDEFVILIRSLDSADKSLGVASLIAEKLIAEASRPINLNQHEIRITASIGIVVSPNDGDTSEILLRNADTAMYHAKDHGRNNFQFYSDDLNTTARFRMEMESRLRRALEKGEFLFHYQPKVDPVTNSITSAEALLRWDDEEEGLIPPGRYIHIAEEIGLTTNIGIWGLKQVCNQAKIWNGMREEPLRVSINISPQHFLHGDLLKHVEVALLDSGLDASLLEIEITESTAMTDIEHTVAVMNKLNEMGVYISIDDFGTGYSSLTHLKHFPAYALKIDRTFINQITHDKKDMAIVRSTMVLAHNLGLKVIAEGVETHEQFEILVSLECDEMQGYLFSKPVPVYQFNEIITRERKRSAKA